MGVHSISSGSPHARPMWALSTCGEPDELKKNTHPKILPVFFFRAPAHEQVRGAQGVLGFSPSDTGTGPTRSVYDELYARRSSPAGCARGPTQGIRKTAGPDMGEGTGTGAGAGAGAEIAVGEGEEGRRGPYCDSDGAPMAYPAFALEGTDAIIAYAAAMHIILAGGKPIVHRLPDGGSRAMATGPHVYTEMLRLGAFVGVGSTAVALDPETGDRIDSLWLQSLQPPAANAGAVVVHVATFDPWGDASKAPGPGNSSECEGQPPLPPLAHTRAPGAGAGFCRGAPPTEATLQFVRPVSKQGTRCNT